MIAAIVGLIVYAHLAEYALHRWAMHRPLFGRRSSLYRDHHVEHHGRGRNDLNITISAGNIAMVASPLLIGCAWLGGDWAACVFLASIVYSEAWTAIHSAHHATGCMWVRSVPGFHLWSDHHAKHHTRPNRNFGTLFPWTDFVFFTKN